MSEQEINHAERIGKLETAVSSISLVVNRLEQGQEKIIQTLSDAGKTNWTVVIAALAVLLSFALVVYGAAIHPLSQDIERTAKSADRIADAIILQNEKWDKGQAEQDKKIVLNETDVIRISDRVEVLERAVKRFDEQGSTSADKRLSLLEYQMNNALLPLRTQTSGRLQINERP